MAGVSSYVKFDQVGSRQYGLITLSQLDAAGVTPEMRRRLLGQRYIVAVRPRVYRLCGAPPSWRSSALAVVLSIGSGCLLSHSSAGILWGLLGQHDQAGAIEVTHRRDRELPGVMVHRHGLRESSATVRFGIPVTTVERTILDLAERTETVDIGLYMDDALRRDLTTPGRLAAEAATVEHHGRRRLRPYLQALEDRGLGYDPGANDWEQRMDRMWDRLGLPPARRQYRLRIAGRTFKLDRAIVEAKIAVEWNGHSPHGERSRFDYDSDRRALLIGAGWLPLDFTSRSSPELIRKTVLSAYEQRRRDRDIRAVG